jgi:hypothetical protein
VTAIVSGSALVFAMSGTASAAPTIPITANGNGGWSAYPCCNARPPSVYLDSQNVVHLQGAFSENPAYYGQDLPGHPRPGNAYVLAVPGSIPSTYAPDRNVFTIVHTGSGTYADLMIGRDGSIDLLPSYNTNTQFVSLEGISYFNGTFNPATCPYCVQPLAYGSNWTSTGIVANVGAGTAGYWEDSNQTVHLRGAVSQTNGSGDNYIGSVPLSVAPLTNVYTMVHTGYPGTYTQILIASNGSIWLMPNGTNVNRNFVSLESITYSRAETLGLFTALNPDRNWSSPGGYGSNWTGYYQDPDGIVHLQGAVAYTGRGDPNSADLIATLPQYDGHGNRVAPTHNVFTIIDAGGGAYAHLMIGTDGRIWLMTNGTNAGPHPGFVSLEGITFQPYS